MIVDAGVYEYQAGKWRNHFRSTQAHNTVTVDGLDQSLFWGNFRVANIARSRLCSWHEAPQQIRVEGEHYGYTRLKAPVTHRRRIAHKEPLQWEITDTLLNPKGGHHQYDWWFHLSPAHCTIDQGMQRCMVQFANGAQLWVALQEARDVQITLEEGWLSPEWKKKERAPIIRFSCSCDANVLTLTTLLTVDRVSVPENKILRQYIK